MAPYLIPFEMSVLNADIHRDYTRQRYEAHFAPRSSNTIAWCFIHKGPTLWHELPTAFKSINSKKLFTTKVKYWLVNQY